MGKAKKRQVKGYYFSLRTQMPSDKDGRDEFRILDGNDIRMILDEIRRTQLRDRFRDDYILTLRGDSVRGDGVDLPEFEGYTSALFMRRRSADLPRTAHEDGDGITMNRIEIGDDSFFMETTYVLIHDATATVLFLVNGNVSNNTMPFARYLKCFLFGDETRYLETVPILNTDSMRRMDGLEKLLGIELCYRGVLDVIDDQNRSRPMGSILSVVGEASRNQNTGSIKLIMTAGRNRSLDKSYARIIHDKVMSDDDSRKNTSIFRVKGKGDSGIETIDFLNDEFLFTMTTDASARNLDPRDVLSKMHSHFKYNLGHILDVIGS